jgi:hypothetical protein
MFTGESPFPELNADNEDEIRDRFERYKFPHLEILLGGGVIRNCWTRVYNDATEAMDDLKRWEDTCLPPSF